MRKRLITATPKNDCAQARGWLDIDEAAFVEVTSEAAGYPIEGALLHHSERGWRADVPGPQTIRLVFDSPQTIQVIWLVFKEEEVSRTQEFLLRWLPCGGSWRDVLRQQWTFSPPFTVTEHEEYRVELSSASALEVSINPSIGSREARASLEQLRLSVS